MILKIKNAKLGSVDKESHYLIHCLSNTTGNVLLLDSADKNTTALNEKSRQSTKYAIIVLRDDMKKAAQKVFGTPLIFSVHEAKGLEYENVILFDFLSCEEKSYLAICQGLDSGCLLQELKYARSKDKSDRSLEIYKFYINAIYVAITRSIKNVYWIESKVKHPLFNLLQINLTKGSIELDAEKSSIEEWQIEAQKLEQQGKQEQATAIRENVVKEQPIPWKILCNNKIEKAITALREKTATKQNKIELLEYSVVYNCRFILQMLIKDGFKAAMKPNKSRKLINRKYFDMLSGRNLRYARQLIERHGINIRNPFNQTLLMIAAYTGNTELANMLIVHGAAIDLTDNFGKTAFMVALDKGINNPDYMSKYLSFMYDKLSPSNISVKVDDRLIKLDQSTMEYFLLALAMVFMQSNQYRGRGFTASMISQCVTKIADSVLPSYRKKRPYISSILAKNELNSSNQYSRKILMRVRTGYYIINPDLAIKSNNEWVNIYQILKISPLKTHKEDLCPLPYEGSLV